MPGTELLPGQGRWKFEFEAGLLVRRKVKFELEKYCRFRNLKLELTESKGILDSDFYVEITGPADDVRAAKRDIQAFFEELSKE